MKTSRNYLKIIVSLFVIIAAGIVLNKEEFSSTPPPISGQHHDKYQCPMHPQIVQDHPGDCPICHMHLEKVEEDESTQVTKSVSEQPKVTKYRNPMDPTVFSDHPMKDSMGMDYIPVVEDMTDGETAGVAGKAGFTLSQERQQLIGVRTTAVELKPLMLTLKMPGRVSSRSRISAQLLEIDAGSVKTGMKARIEGPQGKSVEARVIQVDEELDSLTRSFGIVLEASEEASWLRPGVFCQIMVEANLGKRLSVPDEAILDTGDRQVLFVADNKGHFEPRQIVLGEAGDDWVEVKQGVKEGELVVTSANFLIDSESRFQAALKQF